MGFGLSFILAQAHMSAVLAGLTVLVIEQAVAAPLCSCRLADAGARVIKVERPGGDFARNYDTVAAGTSSYFAWLNRGKQSVAIDFAVPEDRQLLDRIVRQADVVVQNLKHGALERAGFDVTAWHIDNPKLIRVNISGYANDGIYANRKAYDLLIQAESGLCSITGGPQAAGRVGVSVTDIAAGMFAYQAVLEALLERAQTGLGKTINISMFAAMAEWMTVPLLHYEHNGVGPERVGLRHPSIAPYGVFVLRDASQVLLGVQNEREWQAFCGQVLRKPALAFDEKFASNVKRVAHRGELDRQITAVLCKLDKTTAIKRLNQADIAYGLLSKIADLAQHPDLQRVRVTTPGGSVMLPCPPAADTEFTVAAVPEYAEHSAMIRQEFLT